MNAYVIGLIVVASSVLTSLINGFMYSHSLEELTDHDFIELRQFKEDCEKDLPRSQRCVFHYLPEYVDNERK